MDGRKRPFESGDPGLPSWIPAFVGMSGDYEDPASIRLHARFHRILDVLDLVELDIDDLAVDLLDAPDIDRLDDVARLGIDRDRTARAFPRHAFHRGDQRFAVGLAAGLLQRLVDRVHAV